MVEMIMDKCTAFFVECFDLCQNLVEKIICTNIFSPSHQLFIKTLSVLMKMSEFDALPSKQSVNLSKSDRLMFAKILFRHLPHTLLCPEFF